jgi:hypothetical protein
MVGLRADNGEGMREAVGIVADATGDADLACANFVPREGRRPGIIAALLFGWD